jgi:hypothetical protein
LAGLPTARLGCVLSVMWKRTRDFKMRTWSGIVSVKLKLWSRVASVGGRLD